MENKTDYTIGMMCDVLEVSRSSYYNWQSGRTFKPKKHKENMQIQIRNIYFQHKQRYGSPRIAAELRANGIQTSKQTVARYVKELELRSKRSKKYVATTDSKHNNRVFENILNRRFNQQFLQGAWVSDITYIQTKDGFLYQTAIIDLEDRKVIGCSHSEDLSAEHTTLSAFRMAIKNRPPKKDLIFHSDRGVQYTCSSFVNLLNSYGVTQSMCRKGNCWDNAVVESYFKTLKSELIYGNKLVSKQEMKSMLFEYVEVYYSQNRRHSALGNLTIKEFTELKLKKIA
ncbi:MAG: IS3 family transposase [Bacteroidales bacterium]|nr:IS3 family transposase [Bacteroidales bacterium]